MNPSVYVHVDVVDIQQIYSVPTIPPPHRPHRCKLRYTKEGWKRTRRLLSTFAVSSISLLKQPTISGSFICAICFDCLKIDVERYEREKKQQTLLIVSTGQ